MKELYVIVLTARPGENSRDYLEVGGAYVVAWIDASNDAEALASASRLVNEKNWVVDTVESVARRCKAEFGGDASGFQHFDQALADKEVLVFHTWPSAPQPSWDVGRTRLNVGAIGLTSRCN